MRSVDVTGLSISPVPPGEGKVGDCSTCLSLAPRWSISTTFYCSPCFVHGLLRGQMEEVARLIANVETELGRPLERDGNGWLTEKEADRIAGGLVIAQRFESAKKRNDSK